MIDAEIVVLDTGIYIKLDTQPALLGPLKRAELKAILRALLEWVEEEV